MDTTTSVVLTGGIVALGKWAKDEHLEIRVYVGVGVLAVFLAAIGNANPKLAEQFAALVLIGAVLMYAIPVAKALGFTK